MVSPFCAVCGTVKQSKKLRSISANLRTYIEDSNVIINPSSSVICSKCTTKYYKNRKLHPRTTPKDEGTSEIKEQPTNEEKHIFTEEESVDQQDSEKIAAELLSSLPNTNIPLRKKRAKPGDLLNGLIVPDPKKPCLKKVDNRYFAHCILCDACARKDRRKKSRSFRENGRLMPLGLDPTRYPKFGDFIFLQKNCKGHKISDGKNTRLCNKCYRKVYQSQKKSDSSHAQQAKEPSQTLEKNIPDKPQVSSFSSGLYLNLNSFVELTRKIHTCCPAENIVLSSCFKQGEYVKGVITCETCKEPFEIENSPSQKILCSKENPQGFFKINVSKVFGLFMNGESYSTYETARTGAGPFAYGLISKTLYHKIEKIIREIVVEKVNNSFKLRVMDKNVAAGGSNPSYALVDSNTGEILVQAAKMK